MQAAFRDLHGARLHAFCLLLSLGDRPSAARAAASAIAEAIPRVAERRHPERAAAWLRAAAARSLLGMGGSREPEAGRREALRALGITDVAFDGLAGLQPRERAAFVAGAIERLEPIDVEAVLRTDAAGARGLLERARRRYLAAATAGAERRSPTGGGDAPTGGLIARIEAVAERAVGGGLELRVRRGAADAGSGLHARFAAWLRVGEPADPPRDLAVHAAHCVRCRAAVVALDDLLLVDLGRAAIPPARSVAPERAEVVGRPRALAAASATVVGAAIAWMGLGALAPGPVGDLVSQPSTDQGVLGGLGAGGSSASPSMTPSVGLLVSGSGTTSSSAASPSASDAVEAPLVASITARPVPSSEPPSPNQPPTRTAPPSRTPVPTATPTAEPTPTTPDQSPVLDDCENGIDDDGDTIVDGDDRGCVLAGDEASA